ncbi:MAG: 5,6-dimethylbenzimidazole synthase [Pseudotabrizicola sp.]|uniref:5,6-dimethylbenzimidazole synthase n=1 Tax=Pseudotabrizicola sp. TaxID=2939647 RepID=UPI0027309D1F|nr:5,6-dimethylbenzimidazole synthase [Pseudotabrizicola sp.]MDP2080218.1 5,6-dimethylbenzimidazole synthase [Pseudotabrizicola sp.]MDZ7575301.1 5,6-dimethylbenzimidazole synthase [Pseudotabrizicola sp.]
MEFLPAQADTLNDILRWRRDVRHFRTDPVAEPVIDRLQGAMDMAPSVGNSRPWRVLRVMDPGKRAAVREIFERCNHEAAAGYDDATKAEYVRLKLAGLGDAPVHLAVFIDTIPAEGRGFGRRTMPEPLQFSTVMAIHTLWLAARTENMGLGWVSILEPAAVQSLFDVPRSWVFTGYLCLGHAEFADDRPLLHRAGWQCDTPTHWQVY